jgi:ABC-type multidrug transport system ATPase subunit
VGGYRPVAMTLPTPVREPHASGGGRPLVLVRGLSRRFGGREVVSRLDLRLDDADRVALWGPNGSGKTTVLRCLAGTLDPSGGEATIGGHPAGSLAARRLVGVSLSQERSFYMRLSARDNLVFFARLRGDSSRSAKRTVRELEEELELTEILAERADRCSSGMLQQLALARALLGRPRLLLLDEPTRSLDAAAAERLWSALESRRCAVLMATHRPEDVERCAGRVDLPS